MNEKVKKHVIIMSVLGICMSGIAILVAKSLFMLVIMGMIPLGCSVAFLVTRRPVFGILYTVLFGLNRISVLNGGTLLAVAGIIALLVYFSYVDYLCVLYFRQQKDGTESTEHL